MRLLLASAAVAVLFSFSPASAMCGGGQQAGAGGMCGASGGGIKKMSEWPVAPQAQPQQPQTGMAMGGCPCCKNMAMMGGGMKADDPHKGMDMPKN